MRNWPKRARLLNELEQANKELEAFSYTVSHDLRAPLRAINGFIAIVMEDFGTTLSSEVSEYLGHVRDNSRQMGQLIEDLLAFSRLGRQPLQKEAFDLTELFRDVIRQLARSRVPQFADHACRTGSLPGRPAVAQAGVGESREQRD